MEIWKPIPEWEDKYEASSEGRIRSIARVSHTIRNGVPFSFSISSKILKAGLNDKGYKRVTLGRKNCETVHRLIAKTFVEGFKPGLEVCHNDGNRLNNLPGNLRWDTHANNVKDIKLHGKNVKGSNVWTSKLTEEKVKWILENKIKANNSQMAKELGVSTRLVRRVVQGKTWSHLC